MSCLGSRISTITVYFDNDGILNYTTGCFSGNEEEFRKKIINTHNNNNAKIYFATVEFVKKFFELQK